MQMFIRWIDLIRLESEKYIDFIFYKNTHRFLQKAGEYFAKKHFPTVLRELWDKLQKECNSSAFRLN